MDNATRAGIPDAVDPSTRAHAAEEQAEEQERLVDEAHRRLRGDPGDPRDRLPESEHELLMEQTHLREFHP
jgi:hypothetical protein